MYLPKNYQQLRNWTQTNLGRYVLRQETSALSSILNNNFLKNILIIGEPEFSLTTDESLIERNKSINQFILHPVLNSPVLHSNDHNHHDYSQILEKKPKTQFIAARLDKLPIDTGSIDVVLLPHSLEMVYNPHEVLRESHRVLKPEGKIIITGFNYFSVWAIYRLLAKILIKAPWRNNFLSVIKLIDWLALLGFDEIIVKNYCCNLPINNQKILNKFEFLDRFLERFNNFLSKFLPFSLGNIYTISACKRVIPLIPVLRKKWDDLPLDDELAKNILKS